MGPTAVRLIWLALRSISNHIENENNRNTDYEPYVDTRTPEQIADCIRKEHQKEVLGWSLFILVAVIAAVGLGYFVRALYTTISLHQ